MGASRKPTAAPCSWTNSGLSPCRRRIVFCARLNRRDHSDRRVEADQRRRQDCCGHERESARAGRKRPVPRRPVGSSVVRGDHVATASCEAGRHSVARRAFRPTHGRRARLADWPGFTSRASAELRPLRGPATCASSGTPSSEPFIATRIPSARSTRSSSIRSTRRGRRQEPNRATPCPFPWQPAAWRRLYRPQRRFSRRPTIFGVPSQPMNGSCWRTRSSATASTRGRRRPR